MVVAEFHTHCHRAFELRDSTLLKVLERSDAFRRAERFEIFLLACEADARGRTGFEDRPYEQADYLRDVFAAANSVDAGAVAATTSGPAIPEAIRQARLAAIRAFRNAREACS